MSDAPFMSTETKPLTMSAEREAEIRRARDIDILSRVGEELLAELNATRTAHAETRDAYQSLLETWNQVTNDLTATREQYRQICDAINTDGSLESHEDFLMAAQDGAHALNQINALGQQLTEAQGAAIEIAKAKADQWIQLLEARKDTERRDWMCKNIILPLEEDGKWQIAYCPMQYFDTSHEAIDAAMAAMLCSKPEPEGLRPAESGDADAAGFEGGKL